MMIKRINLLTVLVLCAAVCGVQGKEFSDEELKAPGPVKQNSFTHCQVDFAPGEKYLTRKREWQGCPTILRTPKGTLYAGWYAGGPGEGLLNYSLMVKSTDNGRTWSAEPLLVIDSLTRQKIQSLDIQYWLDPDGKFWYFWTQRDYNYPQRHPRHLSVWAITCDDPDAAQLKWSKPFFVSPGFLRCQPTVLKDGRWILCAYDWVDEYYRYSESFDKGRTWFRRRAGKKHPQMTFDETMMFQQKDGTLRLLARCAKKVGALIECRSKDGGKTWSDGVLSDIPNPSSRFFIKRLRSGNVLMINNWDKNDRFHLTAAISMDDGKTWKHKLLLDPRRCTYPDAVEGADGEIFIVHDFGRGDYKEILLSRLTERDIIDGFQRNALTDPNSFLQHIINKAPHPAVLTPAEAALSAQYRNKDQKATRFIVELMSKSYGTELTRVDMGKIGTVSPLRNGSGLRIDGNFDLTPEWQEFSFTFVPSGKQLNLGFRSRGFVDFDDIKIENGILYNGSFEVVNRAGEIDGWRYYTRDTPASVRKAADGKIYMRTFGKAPFRQVVVLQPGKVVTVRFKARTGNAFFMMPNTPWVSSGRRMVR